MSRITKLWRSSWEAFYAGVAGGVLLFYFRYVSVGFFSLDQAILYLSMIIIGGLGHVRGAVVGVILVQGLQDRVTRDLPGLLDTILGFRCDFARVPVEHADHQSPVSSWCFIWERAA